VAAGEALGPALVPLGLAAALDAGADAALADALALVGEALGVVVCLAAVDCVEAGLRSATKTTMASRAITSRETSRIRSERGTRAGGLRPEPRVRPSSGGGI
jgi:hypothetical protein